MVSPLINKIKMRPVDHERVHGVVTYSILFDQELDKLDVVNKKTIRNMKERVYTLTINKLVDEAKAEMDEENK